MTRKVLFIISVVLSVLGAISLVLFGVYEILLDQDEAKVFEHNKQYKIVITHIFISLLIFCSCNFLILFHVLYIAQYVLRGKRYNWHLSVHYMFYLILEIISVICIIGKYQYLNYPLILHIMTGVLATFLFFFNCWAMEIFDYVEDKYKEEQELKAQSTKSVRVKRSKVSCVRIPLYKNSGNPVNPTPGPSQ